MALLFLSASCFGAEIVPIKKGVLSIKDTLFGSTGIALATIIIGGISIACAHGHMEWVRLFQAVICVCIFFGSPAIVAMLKSLVGA